MAKKSTSAPSPPTTGGRASSLDAVAVCIQAGLPYILWGPPGKGKTRMIEAINRVLDIDCITIIAATLEPPELVGWAVPNVDRTALNFLVSPFAKRALQNAERGKKSHIFADEVSCAPPAVQSALLRPILDNAIGDVILPKEFVGWGAAANPTDQAAEGWELRPPMANRFVHLQHHFDAREWTQRMLSGFPDLPVPILPEDWRTHHPLTRALIGAFIHSLPLNIHTLTVQNGGGAWASPRTWDMASLLLAATRSLGLKDTSALAVELVSGCVGEGPAREFVGFVRDADLPDPEDLLKDPEKFILPERGDKAYAIMSSVIAAVLSKNTELRWYQAWKVMGKAADQGATDLAASCVQVLCEEPNMPKGAIWTKLPPELDKLKSLMIKAGMATQSS